jgi:hypothetical protein
MAEGTRLSSNFVESLLYYTFWSNVEGVADPPMEVHTFR